MIKMCGIISVEDVVVVVRVGVDYVGMIVWFKFKRFVFVSLVWEIVVVVRENGVELVGVFVDESVMEIESVCSDVNFDIV